MKYSIAYLTILLIAIADLANAQEWDDTQNKVWPSRLTEVEITSTTDGKMQKAYFYASSSSQPQPLIVSLHTWSGNYEQKDPLVKQILEKNWNYIHPDFRGSNYTSEACGSSLVTSDIDDAIDYALQNSNSDLHNIHVIGVSGGGYATLLAYMKSKHQVSTFAAWASISDLNAWYYETKARKLKYASHISLATTGDSTGIDVEEAKKRSPFFMSTPVEKRQDSKLFIYSGVHDGYTGSVPISHSLNIFNKIVKDYGPTAAGELIPDQVIHRLVTTRSLPGSNYGRIGNRKIHYQKRYEDKLQVTIFEGGHEMLVEEGLKHVPSQIILAIGDSNGAMEGGWVDQLKAIRFQDKIINTAISGNTVGFVNNGQAKLNTLSNIEKYLHENDPEKNRLDKIVILLGTNDSKAEFSDRQDEVMDNYRQLLEKIKKHYTLSSKPEIILVSPPPYGNDEGLQEKYKGAGARVEKITRALVKLAEKNGMTFIDIHTPLRPVFEFLSPDGVHLTSAGQQIVAEMIDEALSRGTFE